MMTVSEGRVNRATYDECCVSFTRTAMAAEDGLWVLGSTDTAKHCVCVWAQEYEPESLCYVRCTV